MAVKKCCIDNCNSCSMRTEDVGVTFHKFPKDVALRDIWISVTHYKNVELPTYVCSRHFCKTDFQIYKDSKYVLKSDAVPSIFSWDKLIYTMDTSEVCSIKTAEDVSIEENKASTSRKDSEGENVDAIKKFIEDQDREIQEQKLAPIVSMPNDTKHVDNADNMKQCLEETLSMASSVINMILDQSELEIEQKKDSKPVQSLSPIDKGHSSMALSIGSKVEAKDFSEEWYPAQIIEVDYEEMEVLVHYENELKKHDEWISVSSPRLRPTGTGVVKAGPSSAESVETPLTDTTLKVETKETKVDEKVKLTFAVGERCLARWRDNRRFMATILNDLGNGKYEIIFDDGCHWSCMTNRLYKLRPTEKELTVDTSVSSPTASTPSPGDYGTGPSEAAQPNPVSQYPAYHTHLFDPTRDYLGSKSERREKKRKLNIKEIFNIGQKRQKTKKDSPKPPVEKKPRVMKKKLSLKKESVVKSEVKAESAAVNAVASIIGTLHKEEPVTETVKEELCEVKVEAKEELEVLPAVKEEIADAQLNDQDESMEVDDAKADLDQVLEEEVKLEKFEKQENDCHEEVIVRMKEVINKLEDGLIQDEKANTPTPEIKEPTLEIPKEEPKPADVVPAENVDKESPKKTKPKKSRKLRLLQEKKVKKQVEKVKSELEEMKRQVEEMRKAMLMKSHVFATAEQGAMMPESFLLPGEWCCKWVNRQPVGTVSEIECEMKADPNGKPPLPRRSVQVEDKRLPEGWTKHMVRRSLGHSAGKWDVVLVSPDNKRFHTKHEMRLYLESNPDLEHYEHALTDFGVHLKLSRRMGWIVNTPDGATDGPTSSLPVGSLSGTSPLVKRRSLSLKKKGIRMKQKRPRLTIKMKVPRQQPETAPADESVIPSSVEGVDDSGTSPAEGSIYHSNLEDGYVYVGSLKVQIIENLLRCPAEGCFKNFRNNTLLQMHIKHYHRELRKMLGATPKVLDLAYARTMPIETETPRISDQRVLKVKLPRLPRREEPKEKHDLQVDSLTPTKEPDSIPRSQDSPKLRQALAPKPLKRPRVLLPVRRLEPELAVPDSMNEDIEYDMESIEQTVEVPMLEPLDFETEISTHTVTRPFLDRKRKSEKRRRPFVLPPKMPISDDDDWFGINSDVETRSSFPRSGTPDSKMDLKMAPISSESNEDKDAYMYTENGERIKIVHMKREEIINCHCGFREEDGLMVQCELCLCWQHALCHNIQKESEVPEKYTCSICLNPRRGRRSQRFLHSQERMYEGTLAGARASLPLRRSHELSGNLLRVRDALHALTLHYYVATKKDHPKLYLWAKDWEQLELQYTQEKLNSDYSDLNIMINTIGKENLPVKPDVAKDIQLDMATPPSEEHDRYAQREGQLGSQALLNGLLSSPGGASLDLPISTLELERLAKSVQEQECSRPAIRAPQPEAAIENSVCRERLLKHIQRCQALIDARLDSIEAQVAELESQDPSFEDDETADYFPRTKQTVQMLMRDLDTMEELGVIT